MKIKMNRAVIICGADISDYAFSASYIEKEDFIIFCDSGLKHALGDESLLTGNGLLSTKMSKETGDSNVSPRTLKGTGVLVVGDFDSWTKGMGGFFGGEVEVITLPTEKDDTDSVYAIKTAIARGYKEIILLGAIGNRLDHSLVNVYALKYMHDNGVTGKIVDDYSEMSLIYPGDIASVDSKWSYFSLVAIDGNTKGVTIRNAKYNLDNADINSSYQYATSNEVVSDAPAEITIKEGVLLLVCVRNDSNVM